MRLEDVKKLVLPVAEPWVRASHRFLLRIVMRWL